jgi:hypothetical protein
VGELRVFVKWDGGPSLWLCNKEGKSKLSFLNLGNEKRERISRLITGVINRHSSTTFPTTPIPFSEGDTEELCKIFGVEKKDELRAAIALELI